MNVIIFPNCFFRRLVTVQGRVEPFIFFCLTTAKGTQETPNLEIWGSALANLLVMTTAKSEI
jgi:hypothetical protein